MGGLMGGGPLGGEGTMAKMSENQMPLGETRLTDRLVSFVSDTRGKLVNELQNNSKQFIKNYYNIPGENPEKILKELIK